MIRWIHIISLILSAILWTGCTRPSLNSQQKSFLLETPPNPVRASVCTEGILKIRHCRAIMPFDNPYFLYRTQSGQYQQDYYKMFLTPPNEQVNEYLRTWLDQSGLFNTVLPASSGAMADYILESQLTAIYADISEPSEPETVIRMYFVLLKTDKDYQPGIIVMEKTCQHISTMPGKTAQDVITGYNLCLEAILTQMQSEITSALKERAE